MGNLGRGQDEAGATAAASAGCRRNHGRREDLTLVGGELNVVGGQVAPGEQLLFVLAVVEAEGEAELGPHLKLQLGVQEPEQGCGSGFNGSVDPDLESASASGSRREKMTHKSGNFFF